MTLTTTQVSQLNNMNMASQRAGLGTLVKNLDRETTQAIVAAGAVTIKNGVVTLAKTVAGAMACTIADPTATTDDGKKLLIINAQAQANTLTSASSFGGGGAGADVATFGAAIGNTLSLEAYQGKWYIVGQFGVTVA